MIKRWIITTLLMVGLTLVSFGHHGLAPDKQAQAEAYVLAGGHWADLCSDGSDPFGIANKCMACVISAGCTVPAHDTAPQHNPQLLVVGWSTSDQTVQSGPLQRPQAARAPPFHLI